MAVDKTDVIDFIGIEAASGEVVLTVTDALAWEDAEHLLLLQEKLNTYLDFVESGEILTNYPLVEGRQVRIELVYKHPPDAHGESFLRRVAGIIGSAGIRFRHRLHAA